MSKNIFIILGLSLFVAGGLSAATSTAAVIDDSARELARLSMASLPGMQSLREFDGKDGRVIIMGGWRYHSRGFSFEKQPLDDQDQLVAQDIAEHACNALNYIAVIGWTEQAVHYALVHDGKCNNYVASVVHAAYMACGGSIENKKVLFPGLELLRAHHSAPALFMSTVISSAA